MKNSTACKALLLLILLGIPENTRGDVYLTKHEALKVAFAGADRIEKKTVILLARQQEEIARLSGVKDGSRIFTYYVGIKDEGPVGYAAMDSARGRSRRFKFMLVVDLDLSVRMIEILSYHDTHGSEIRQGWFRRQFVGKTISDPLRVYEDIRNVSGATLSCEALVERVRVLLSMFEAVVSKAPGKPGEHNVESKKESVGEAIHLPGKSNEALPPSVPFRRAQFRMGTLMEVTLYARDARMVDLSFHKVFAEVGRLEILLGSRRVDPWDRGVLWLGASRTKRVDPEIVQLLQFCLRMHRVTLGAFDVTIAPLTHLWSQSWRMNRLPTREEVNRARGRVGAKGLRIHVSEASVAAPSEGTGIDLGGIAKGYALDRSVSLLREEGIEAALLNFGGIIRAYGPGPDQGKWTIHVGHPGDRSKSLAVLHIREGAVSTSGDSERSLDILGRTYSHILDPRTGWPVTGMVSVTVVAPSAAEADALSTGIYVLGLEQGRKVLESRPLAALVVSEKGAFRTEAFRGLASDS